MNTFVESPEWGWWIIGYFFLGGIAAGAYFTAAFLDIFGDPADRPLARYGYLLALPLIVICGVFLTVDLDRPMRFWHMLLRSEVVDQALDKGWPKTGEGWSLMWNAPQLKWYSPMSIGSWALFFFGFFATLSFLGSIEREGRLAYAFRFSWFGKLVGLIGSAFGFFIAAYTGALVTATNQPFWSDTVWVAPLFAASSAATGMAAMILFARLAGADIYGSIGRLDRARLWTTVLELVIFVVFLVSLGNLAPALLRLPHGLLFVLGVAILGLAIPLLLELRTRMTGKHAMVIPALFVLAGGFALRWGLLKAPDDALYGRTRIAASAPESSDARGSGPYLRISPEDGRQRGEAGAGRTNVAVDVEKFQPLSKVFVESPKQ
jgi:formate-dependent nitrite reductase membrane component NrfD